METKAHAAALYRLAELTGRRPWRWRDPVDRALDLALALLGPGSVVQRGRTANGAARLEWRVERRIMRSRGRVTWREVGTAAHASVPKRYRIVVGAMPPPLRRYGLDRHATDRRSFFRDMLLAVARWAVASGAVPPVGVGELADALALSPAELKVTEEMLDDVAADLIVPERALAAALSQGLDLPDLVERFGCDEETICALLRRAGLVRRSGMFPRAAGGESA